MDIRHKNSPMATMGDYESTLPFKAIGLDVAVITDENRAQVGQIINKFAVSGYAVLFMEESLFNEFIDIVNEISESTDLSIVPLPNQSGSMNVGLDSIRRSVERAVGMDIFGVK